MTAEHMKRILLSGKIRMIEKKPLKHRFKGRIRALSAAVALLILCLSVLSGCSGLRVRLTTGLSRNDLFRVEKKACSVGEAKLFLMSQKHSYEDLYGERIWNVPVGETTFADYLSGELEGFLVQLTCMALMADDRDLSLTKAEKSQVAAAAKDYYNDLSDAEKDYLGLSQSEIEEIYTDYRLAEKLAEDLTSGANTEISDDEARGIEVEEITWPITQTDAEGNTAKLSYAERQSFYVEASDVAARAADGEDFQKLAGLYTDGTAESARISRGEREESWEEVVFSLGSGEVSGVIETDSAYCVVYCVSNLCEAETEENRETIREERRAEAFYESFEEYVQDLTFRYAENGWEELSFTADIPSGTADFYAVYDKYFGTE